jgi:hypothetical protein
MLNRSYYYILAFNQDIRNQPKHLLNSYSRLRPPPLGPPAFQ